MLVLIVSLNIAVLTIAPLRNDLACLGELFAKLHWFAKNLLIHASFNALSTSMKSGAFISPVFLSPINVDFFLFGDLSFHIKLKIRVFTFCAKPLDWAVQKLRLLALRERGF